MSTIMSAQQQAPQEEPVAFEPVIKQKTTDVPWRTAIAIMTGQFECARGGSNGAYLEMMGITSYHGEGYVTFVDIAKNKEWTEKAETIIKPRIRPKDMKAVARMVSASMCKQDSDNPFKQIDMKATREKAAEIAAIPDYAEKHKAFEAFVAQIRSKHNLPTTANIDTVRLPEKYYNPRPTKKVSQAPQLKIV